MQRPQRRRRAIRRLPPVRTSAGVDVGRTLRRERTRRRITLLEVAEETKILRRYLEALEANGDAGAYPAPVYARAFLREYCAYLGIDPAPLLAVFRAGDDPTEDLEALLPPAPRRRITVSPWLVLAAALVALIAGLAVAGDRLPDGGAGTTAAHRRSAPAPTAPALTAQTPAARAGTSVLAERTARPAGALTVQITVVGEPCWLQATSDGVRKVAETLQPGAHLTITAAHDIELLVGNAGALRIAINGTALEAAGGSGVVRTLRISLSDGAVRVTGTPVAAT